MTAQYHYRSLIVGICFRGTSLNIHQWPTDSNQSSNPAVQDLLLGGEGMNLLFNGFGSSNEENMAGQQEEEVL